MTNPQSVFSNRRFSRAKTYALLVEILVVLAITAVAAYLRFHQIEQVPPGLNSDEAVGAVGALETLRNGLKLHYEGQGASGAIGFYIEALAMALFGVSVATVRGTTAFAGVVSVIATYFLTREMFRLPLPGQDLSSPDREVHLNRARFLAGLAALGLATSLWHVQGSRVAFAAIGVPFLQVPGNYFLWRGLNTGRRIHFVLSGIFLAAVTGVYMSGAVTPFLYAAFFLLEWAIVALMATGARKPLIKQHFWNLVLCAGVALLLFLPMLYFYFTMPEAASVRAEQTIFTNPLINHGDPWGTLWRSFWGHLAAFGISLSWFLGTPPSNLLMPVPITLLFLAGLGVALWKVRRPAYLFLLLSWFMMLIPGIVTPDAIPHPLRSLGASPAAYVLVAFGVLALVDLVTLAFKRLAPTISRLVRRDETAKEKSPGLKPGRLNAWVTAVVVLVILAWVTPVLRAQFVNYMTVWPLSNDAQAAFHVYAVDLARNMSRETNPQAVFLLPRDTAAGDVNPNYTVMFLHKGPAGYAWVVDDETTLEDTLNEAVAGRNVAHVIRWRTSKHTGADPKEILRYYLEKHGRYVDTKIDEYYYIDSYALDEPGPDLTDDPLESNHVEFNAPAGQPGQVVLTGFAYGDASGENPTGQHTAVSGDLMWAHLRFTLEARLLEDVKVSISVLDNGGHVVGQIDKLMLNNILHQGTASWPTGTTGDVYYLVPIAPATAPGEYRVNVAVYGASNGARFSPSGTAGETSVQLGKVTILPDLAPPDVRALDLSAELYADVNAEITLLGFSALEGPLRPGQRSSLALVWQANISPQVDYQAAVWATQAGEEWQLCDWLPLAGTDYPTHKWQAGQVIRGWFDGRIPHDLASGDYQLLVRVMDTGGTSVTDISLGALKVEGWPRNFEIPAMQSRIDANFDGQMVLLGYDFAGSAPDAETGVQVTLYWQGLEEMEANYTTFVHVLDETGQVICQVDHVPGDGAYPTTGWLPGEVIVDRFVIPATTDQISRARQVEIGVYDSRTLERLAVLDQAGQPNDNRVLIPVGVAE